MRDKLAVHICKKIWMSSLSTLLISLSFILYSTANHTIHAQSTTCETGRPFLGIGLGYNQYEVDQIARLSGQNRCQQPLVYNWNLGNSSQTPDYSPHLDFPTRYIPMMWGCRAQGPERVRQFLEERQYSGPVLVFNEPDREDQANCAPETAADLLHELHQLRRNYTQQSGNSIDLYLGGTARSDSGIPWMDALRAVYMERFAVDPFTRDGLAPPVAAGVHFHLYPRFAYPDGAGSLADVNEQLQEWNAWLDQHDMRAWVTEVGVLHAPYQDLPKAEYVYFLERILPILFWNERIDHAFIFTLNSVSGTDSAEFAKSALIEDGVETIAYEFVRGICSEDGSGYCAPNAKRLIVAANSPVEKSDAQEKQGAMQLAVIPTATPRPLRPAAYTRPSAAHYRDGYARNR